MTAHLVRTLASGHNMLTVLTAGTVRRTRPSGAARFASLSAFDPKEFRGFPIEEINTVNHNVKRFRMGLPTPEHQTGMSTASCLLVRGTSHDGKEEVVRPYTPTTTNDTKVVKEALSRPGEDRTLLTLVYCSQTPSDIILKEELDDLAARHRNFAVLYKVDADPEGGWAGGAVGHVTREDVAALLPAPGSERALVAVCGPPGMMAAVCGDKAPDKSQGPLTGLLAGMGYAPEEVYKF